MTYGVLTLSPYIAAVIAAFRTLNSLWRSGIAIVAAPIGLASSCNRPSLDALLATARLPSEFVRILAQRELGGYPSHG